MTFKRLEGSAQATEGRPMKIQAKKLFALVSLTVFLASCRVVGPNYSRPIVPAPDTFRGAPDAAISRRLSRELASRDNFAAASSS